MVPSPLITLAIVRVRLVPGAGGKPLRLGFVPADGPVLFMAFAPSTPNTLASILGSLEPFAVFAFLTMVVTFGFMIIRWLGSGRLGGRLGRRDSGCDRRGLGGSGSWRLGGGSGWCLGGSGSRRLCRSSSRGLGGSGRGSLSWRLGWVGGVFVAVHPVSRSLWIAHASMRWSGEPLTWLTFVMMVNTRLGIGPTVRPTLF